MTLLKGALYKARKSNPNNELNNESPRRGLKNSPDSLPHDPIEVDLHEHRRFEEEYTGNEPTKELSAITNIDFDHTRFQIETMTDAEKDKIYIAKDGGIYVGGENGQAFLKAGMTVVFISERRFVNISNKLPNTLYVIQCVDKLMHSYYKLFCNGVTIYNSTGYTNQDIDELLQKKQDRLESGKNIKTINKQSILGQGDLTIPIIKSDVDTIKVIEESDYDELEIVDSKTLYIIIPDSN